MTNKKELTTKQQIFLDNLLVCGGDAKRAAEIAGYAEGSYTAVVKALKTEILELTQSVLAMSAPQAALKLVNIMNSDEPIPQANIRLQAAQTLLARVGISKTDKMVIRVEGSGCLFILPAKNKTIIDDAEYEELYD